MQVDTQAPEQTLQTLTRPETFAAFAAFQAFVLSNVGEEAGRAICAYLVKQTLVTQQTQQRPFPCSLPRALDTAAMNTGERR